MIGPIDKLDRQIRALDVQRPAQRAAIRLHANRAGRSAARSIASPASLAAWFSAGVMVDQLKSDPGERSDNRDRGRDSRSAADDGGSNDKSVVWDRFKRVVFLLGKTLLGRRIALAARHLDSPLAGMHQTGGE